MRKLIPTIAAILIATVIPALAAGTLLFSSRNGDINFPGLTPTTIDAMAIGVTTPAEGHFTALTSTSPPSGAGNTANFASPPPLGTTAPNTVVASQVTVDTGTKTATAVAGAATLNKMAGVITSEALTTAGLADYTLTLTNSDIAAADQILWSVGNGTNTQGDPVQGVATPAAGSVVIVVRNAHATQALNGTLKIAFVVVKN